MTIRLDESRLNFLFKRLKKIRTNLSRVYENPDNYREDVEEFKKFIHSLQTVENHIVYDDKKFVSVLVEVYHRYLTIIESIYSGRTKKEDISDLMEPLVDTITDLRKLLYDFYNSEDYSKILKRVDKITGDYNEAINRIKNSKLSEEEKLKELLLIKQRFSDFNSLNKKEENTELLNKTVDTNFVKTQSALEMNKRFLSKLENPLTSRTEVINNIPILFYPKPAIIQDSTLKILNFSTKVLYPGYIFNNQKVLKLRVQDYTSQELPELINTELAILSSKLDVDYTVMTNKVMYSLNRKYVFIWIIPKYIKNMLKINIEKLDLAIKKDNKNKSKLSKLRKERLRFESKVKKKFDKSYKVLDYYRNFIFKLKDELKLKEQELTLLKTKVNSNINEMFIQSVNYRIKTLGKDIERIKNLLLIYEDLIKKKKKFLEISILKEKEKWIINKYKISYRKKLKI